MIQDFYENLRLMERRTTSDGMGGFIESFVDGAEFQGAITTSNTIESRVAEKQGVTSLYIITVPLNVPIRYNDIVKRVVNNETFRVTSRPEDMTTPKVSNLEFKQVTAELFKLPII